MTPGGAYVKMHLTGRGGKGLGQKENAILWERKFFMTNQFSAQTFHTLIDRAQDDQELLEFFGDCLDSFRAYEAAILEMEGWMKLYRPATLGTAAYQDRREALDKARSRCHNAVLANVSALNRMAAAQGLEPVYDGTVSEDAPYRRQVADAVLGYLRALVEARV